MADPVSDSGPTLRGASFPTVSPVFPPCYVAAVTSPSEPAPPEQAPALQDWPGQRLGLPESGPGAVAGWGRRLLALVVDWAFSSLVASVVTRRSFWTPAGGWYQWLPLIVFAGEVCVLTLTLGASAGQLVTRLRIHPLRSPHLELLPIVARTLLICLVIPAVIYNKDQRGLHDLAAGTVVVRR